MAPLSKKYSKKKASKIQKKAYFGKQLARILPKPVSVDITNQYVKPEQNGTYFMDEEGQYYYQPTAESVNIAMTVANENDTNKDLSINEEYRACTLMPSVTETGEVSYVLVVPDDKKDLKEESGGDVYVFENEEKIAEAPDDPMSLVKPMCKQKPTQPNYNCNYCNYVSHKKYLLQRHMKTHSVHRLFVCNVCDRTFITRSSLTNHMNIHNGIKPHGCKYCSASFTTSGEVVRHIRYKHTHEKPHRCNQCDYASVELSKLRRHVRCHTGERPYQCPHCTYASPDTFKLKRHLRTHTGEKPYKCDLCNMCFTQSNSLKAHKYLHNVSEKPVYPCELCPAKCGRKIDLRLHIQKLHTSDEPLKCKRCEKNFPDRYTFNVHRKTHVGEKCHKCDLCPYASATLRNLKVHKLTHTDEKPFGCDQCNQCFRQKPQLRRHINLYHNPDFIPKPPKEKTNNCHACNRSFALKGNLIRHMATHDPDVNRLRPSSPLNVDGQNIRSSPAKDSDEDNSGHVKRLKKEATMEYQEHLSDGEYVVMQLEVGEEEGVNEITPDYSEMEGREIEHNVDHSEENQDVHYKGQVKTMGQGLKVEKDLDTYFGFDDEEQETIIQYEQLDDFGASEEDFTLCHSSSNEEDENDTRD